VWLKSGESISAVNKAAIRINAQSKTSKDFINAQSKTSKDFRRKLEEIAHSAFKVFR